MMIPAERKEIIKDTLRQNRSVTVVELSDQLKVSTETVRRDLTALEREGFLEKNHGGATIRNRVVDTVTKQVRASLYTENKLAIARQAAKFIHPGDCIFLDSSTTVFQICQFLKNLPLVVVTTSLDVINFFAGNPNITLICPGGQYLASNNAFMGIDTIDFFRSHSFDKAFISCRSINLENGICDSSELTSEFSRAVIGAATSTFVLADHTKLNKSAFSFTCPLPKISTLIVDTQLSEQWTTTLDAMGVEYLECPLP